MPVTFKERVQDSDLIKEVKGLESKPEGWKAGLDINTDVAEGYVEYRKETDKVDFFGKGFAGAKWNDLSVWGDEEYYGGVSVGVSW